MGYTVEPNQIFCAASEQAGQESPILLEPDSTVVPVGLDAVQQPASGTLAAVARDLCGGALDNRAGALLRGLGDRLGGTRGDRSGT